MEQQTREPESEIGSSVASSASKLSYKFQRLRERLRDAIASGELSGKLPGERVLARRFHANAKTLSKALTDLAAEGLLERSIGRGTFVKGSGQRPASSSESDRWLIISDPDQADSGIIEQIRHAHGNLQVVADTGSLRPSFLNTIKAVIDCSIHTPDSFHRDLVVRNVSVVLVGREPTTYSVNAVLVDRALAGMCIARDMMLSGHRRFLAVERRGQTTVSQALRRAAQRYAPEATVDSIWPADAPAAIEQLAATAIICDTSKSAAQVREELGRHNIPVPQSVSLAAMGGTRGNFPCSGYFVQAQQKAETIVQLIQEPSAKRPTTIWLTGAFYDGGTIGVPEVRPLPSVIAESNQDHQAGLQLSAADANAAKLARL